MVSGLPYQNNGAVTKINVKLNRCKVLSQPIASLRIVDTEYETLLANPAWSVINTIAFLELFIWDFLLKQKSIVFVGKMLFLAGAELKL